MGGGGGPRPSGSATAATKTPDNAPKDVVYVVQGTALRRVPVQLGGTDGRRTEVSGEGIKPGVQVAVDVQEAAE